MAIRVPNLGTGSGAVGDGDNELKIRQDYNHNFNDQSNAASRLVGAGADQIPLSSQVPSLLGTAATKDVGTATGNVMPVGAFGLGGQMADSATGVRNPSGFYYLLGNLQGGGNFALDVSYYYVGTTNHIHAFRLSNTPYSNDFYLHGATEGAGNTLRMGVKIWHSGNATKDPNGFLKGASPIAEIYSDSMILNRDAQEQGGITFEKLGVGDYLVKGSLGFAQEGWYIETPKDANGNVLVAVVYEQLANNDLSIKTYAKKFDDETGDIVANLAKPRDIPNGRFISLRLHELPKEPPVMPMDEPTTEV